jgi:hypothetical protein
MNNLIDTAVKALAMEKQALTSFAVPNTPAQNMVDLNRKFGEEFDPREHPEYGRTARQAAATPPVPQSDTVAGLPGPGDKHWERANALFPRPLPAAPTPNMQAANTGRTGIFDGGKEWQRPMPQVAAAPAAPAPAPVTAPAPAAAPAPTTQQASAAKPAATPAPQQPAANSVPLTQRPIPPLQLPNPVAQATAPAQMPAQWAYNASQYSPTLPQVNMGANPMTQQTPGVDLMAQLQNNPELMQLIMQLLTKSGAAKTTKVPGTDLTVKVEEEESKTAPIDIPELVKGDRGSAKPLCDMLEEKYGTPSTTSIKQAFKEGVAIALAENHLMPSDMEKYAAGFGDIVSALGSMGINLGTTAGKLALTAALLGPPVVGATLGGVHGSLEKIDPEDIESLKGYDEVQSLRHGSENLRKTLKRKQQAQNPGLVEDARLH